MKIATFNVNSLRARMPVFLDWIQSDQPDVVAIQEIKVETDKFPYQDLEHLGYHLAVHGQKSYNGVLLMSRTPMEDVETGILADWATDARCVRAVIGGVLIINTYVPNGTKVGSEKWEYKMKWLEHFAQFVGDIAHPGDPVIWLGDINIAPTPDDVFESAKHLGGVGHHPHEFERLERIVDWGWTDCFRKFTPGPNHYTFWDFRINAFPRDLGWRIDHIYASPGLVEKCERCWVNKDPRTAERPSDHTPVLAEFSL
ncbi:MAG: exodeoxyribonuclease III [Fimbriimonadaceae bacterium]|jgi:exodeoxyribonuclease-3|nr:exodeoxyribonuclease III [Fimbriimonadaceae bacterium]